MRQNLAYKVQRQYCTVYRLKLLRWHNYAGPSELNNTCELVEIWFIQALTFGT